MPSLKKFWNAISTGWVVEYPGRSNAGPADFFDKRSDGQRTTRAQQQQRIAIAAWEEQKREEEEREEAIAKWSAQMRMRDSQQGSRSSVGAGR